MSENKVVEALKEAIYQLGKTNTYADEIKEALPIARAEQEVIKAARKLVAQLDVAYSESSDPIGMDDLHDCEAAVENALRAQLAHLNALASMLVR